MKPALSAAPTASQNQPRNIIFVFIHDMGHADLGCYGNTAIQTPHIDRLANQSVGTPPQPAATHLKQATTPHETAKIAD